MKKFFQHWKKVLSLLLVLVLVVQIVPTQVFAKEPDSAITEPETTIESESEQELETTPIGEVEELREEDVKHFMNTDGSFTAVKYAEPVHFKESEADDWEDIDNTLRLSNGEMAKYTPKNSPIDVEFAEEFSKDKTVSVHSAGYELSWTYLQPDAEITDPIKEEVMSGNAAAETDITKTDNAETSASLPEIEKAVEAEKLDKFANNKIEDDITSFAALDNISDGLVYCDVFPNVDIEYILTSINLKENIVLKNNSAQNEFVAAYDIGSLSAEQIDDRNIELRDEEENVIFCISAPCMLDANGAVSDNVTLSILSEADGVMLVKLTADKKWLQDEIRTYPVKIDPNVFEAVQSFDQDATAIYSSATYPDGSLVVGNDRGSTYSKAKSYVKFSLPTLGAGDVVTSGILYLSQYTGSYGYNAVGTPSMQINVYKVTSSWTGNSVKSSRGYTGLPDIDTAVVDYKKVSLSTANSGEWIQFDVSKTVKQWYEGETNYGLCLRADDESAWALATFAASDNTSISYRKPQLVVTYRSNKGLEGYWSTHEQDLGESGVGYVNDYTGNLVYIAPLVSTTGNKMPVSLSLIYNGYQHGNDIDRANTVGEGWRLNIQEKLTPITRSGGLQTKLYDANFRYVYSDSDGTDHYFKVDSEDSSKIVDEDGLGLTLTVNSTGSELEKYVIKADAGGKMTFTSSGKLRAVYDDNGNFYKIIYKNNGQIDKIKDGANRDIEIVSDTSGRITAIKQLLENNQFRTVTLNYASWGGLRSIVYPGGRTTTFSYTDSGVKLSTVDAINGNRLTYTYPTSGDAATKSRVTKITEYSSNTRETGNSLTINYDGMNRTKFTDNHTPTNRSETYQFDNWGRTVSLIDASGNGSQYSYSSTSGKKNNSLRSTGVASKYVDNRLINHNFENYLSAWDYKAGFVETDTSQHYYGSKSEKLNSGGWVSQVVTKNSSYNYYTASIYARGSSNNSKIELSICFCDSNGNDISSKSSVQDLAVDTWERKQFTFKLPSGAASFRVKYVNCGADNIWIDCAQLENGSAMSAYNMVQNGDFENTSANVWEAINCGSSDNYYTGGTYGRHFYMKGDGSTDKRLIQKIYVNREAKKLFLSVSGYAKAASVPLHWTENRQFSLSVQFHFTDGSDSTYEYIPFNPDYSAGWQYASGTVGVKNPGNKIVDYVYIRCCYYENANQANFDRIQVNIDECGTSYTYDDDGNLISAKDNAGRHESYNYNNANDMTKLTSADNKEYNFTYSDTYKHRLLSATSASSGVKNTFGYDSSGNLTSTRVEKPGGTGKYIAQYSSYTGNGNYLATSYSDGGYATNYVYDGFKGTLSSVTDPNGNTTNYNYDDDTDRMTSVSSDGSTVSYTYNENKLTNINAPGGTNYAFLYDNWGNNTSVTVGGRTLVTNTYAANNGLLDEQRYGNNFVVEHEYDSLDRESSRSYNNGKKFYWNYNADGNLAKYSEYDGSDLLRSLTYTYDDIGRPLQVDGSDGSYIKTSYDDVDKSTQLHYKFNGQRRDVYFHYYDRDNLPSSVNFGTGTNYRVAYSYDDLTRRYYNEYTVVGSSATLGAEYRYVDWRDNSNRTTGTVRGINYTFVKDPGDLSTHDRWYTYDNAGNILTESIWKSDTNSNVLQEKYTYDSKNQLIRHDSVSQNKTIIYGYDNAGNITSKVEYNYTTAATPTGDAIRTVTYEYDETWGDQLVGYYVDNSASGDAGGSASDDTGDSTSGDTSDSTSSDIGDSTNGDASSGTSENVTPNIQYNENNDIGNPTKYLGWNMEWQGRQLTSAKKDGVNLSFSYDSEGIRTSKTVGTTKTEYLLNGTQILAQKTGNNTLCFFYDQQGNRVGMADAGNHFYYYIYNLQGDVIALADASTGKLAATYTYDAWGKIVYINGQDPDNAEENSIAKINPFRYRGYYYDTETGLYYLNSRYYDAETGRFINADAFASTNIGGVLSANMFSYCENNPINTVDYLGHNPLAIFAGVGAAIASALSAAVTAMVALTVTAVAVHTIDQVAEKIKEKVKTTQDTSPRDQSVYILTNKGGDVRYVGRTNNPPRRMAEHERDKNHPERINYKMTVVFSGLTDKQAVLTEQILISAFTLEHLDNARREISAGRIAAFKAEVSSVAELLGGFAEDEIMNLGRRR